MDENLGLPMVNCTKWTIFLILEKKILLAAILEFSNNCNFWKYNALLYGLSKKRLNKLQLVQNCAARLVSGVKKYDHITPVLKSLHWLPIARRIEFKILVLTFKGLNGLAPSYITELLSPYKPAKSLRSKNQHLLSKAKMKCKTFGERSFSAAAPKLWNNLPLNLRSCSKLETFKKELKTHLFRQAYD